MSNMNSKVQCPYCGKYISIGARRCASCGADNVNYGRTDLCDHCDGDGYILNCGKQQTCHVCNGSGKAR